MYKIKHKETKLFFSTTGCRYYTLMNWKPKEYPETIFLTKHGKTWSTERGPTKIMHFLERLYPEIFEVVEFTEKIG